MQFIRVSNYFKVARVTGPSHNMLAIEFCEADETSQIVVESLPSVGDEPAALLPDAVRQNVAEGVSEANQRFRTNYTVKRMQFVRNDSPPVETYRLLASSIIERLANRLPFTETG